MAVDEDDNVNESNSIGCMYAAVCTQYGPAAQTLQVQHGIPRPTLTTDQEVLVKVHSTTVNPADAKQRSGNLQLVTSHEFPWVVGQDFSGTVVAVGSSVTCVKVGDAVLGTTAPRNGCSAEYVVAYEKEVVVKPDILTWEQAAAIPTSYCTAYKGLFEHGVKGLEWKTDQHDASEGPSVLIVGASGSVGSAALHLAVRCSTASSIVAISGPHNTEFCRSLGATKVLDYSDEDYVSELVDHQFDLILDCVGGDDYYYKLHCFVKQRYVSCVGPVLHGGSEPIRYSTLFSTVTTLVPRLLGNYLLPGDYNSKYSLYLDFSTEPLQRILQCHERLFTAGQLLPRLDPMSPVPLEKIAAAHEQVETGHSQGKVVVNVVKLNNS